MRWVRAAGAALLLALLVGVPVPGALATTPKTWPGPAPCNTTLQHCIDSVAAGTVIKIARNTIHEDLTISRSVTLEPAAGFHPTFASQNSHGILIELTSGSAHVSLQSLNVQGGGVTVETSGGTGHVVRIQDVTATGVGPQLAATLYAHGLAPMTLTVLDSTFSNTIQRSGAEIDMDSGGSSSFDFERNVVFSAAPDQGTAGFDAELGGTGTVALDVNSNVFHSWGGCHCGNSDGVRAVFNDTVTATVGIVNNTIDDERSSAGVDFGGGAAGTSVSLLVANNVVSNSTGGYILPSTASAPGITKLTSTNNDRFASGPSEYAGRPHTEFRFDPTYVNAAAHNYRLKRKSPLVDLVAPVVGPSNRFLALLDADGNGRVFDGNLDLGAYEFGSDPGCTQWGSPTADTLVGTPRADVLCGLGGGDIMTSGSGNDVLNGGAGADTLKVQGPGHDVLLGGTGGDKLFANDGAPDDTVNGGPGTDECHLDSGDVHLGCP
jgi:Ca2+-binding RTX toxin-like protein